MVTPLKRSVVEWVDTLRVLESAPVLALVPPGSRILEVGAGTGAQAALFAKAGHDISAIDMPSSGLSPHRDHPIIDYDGKRIPFPDQTFDFVYSASTLEHIPDLDEMLMEMRRVLKPGGKMIHVVPMPAWRLWTSLAAPFGALRLILSGSPVRGAKLLGATILLRPHGERGNALGELYYYRPQWWEGTFRRVRLRITQTKPLGIFYTGATVMQRWLPISSRRMLARVLGSPTALYLLET